MIWKSEWTPAVAILTVFITCLHLPVGMPRFDHAVIESLRLVQWYAREHVLLCLVPAFFIAGAIGVFVSQAAVMKYLGAGANKILAYSVASVSGTILAVCSCTVLPLFAGIYRMGAGFGPAIAFLYSGPAINALAIILTARVLGLELGLARAVGAVLFSIVIGAAMHFLFRNDKCEKVRAASVPVEAAVPRPLWQTALYFASMVAILVFANWSKPDASEGLWHLLYTQKWLLTAVSAVILGFALVRWLGVQWWKVVLVAIAVLSSVAVIPERPLVPFTVGAIGLILLTSFGKGDPETWFAATWGFAKQILPLLLIGVLVAGFLLGQPGEEGLIPSSWVAGLVGGNSLWANLFASVVGAFMYFATLTEVPILQGLIGSGMGQGPALALLLAGPALSLPSMLVLHSIMGLKKTAAYTVLVVAMATISGMFYGAIA
ncbi:MAG: permease [Candidatus Hydrogenedentes bacterium]|nr:permease [Candidatus Hydrogenedentota bacterium]